MFDVLQEKDEKVVGVIMKAFENFCKSETESSPDIQIMYDNLVKDAEKKIEQQNLHEIRDMIMRSVLVEFCMNLISMNENCKKRFFAERDRLMAQMS